MSENAPEPDAPKKRGRKPRLTVAPVAAALVELRGNLAAVAERLGVHRSSVAEFVGKNPELCVILGDQRERRIDQAEDKLWAAVDAGEAWAIALTLKTIGKGRGYVERVDLRTASLESFLALLPPELAEATRQALGPGVARALGDMVQTHVYLPQKDAEGEPAAAPPADAADAAPPPADLRGLSDDELDRLAGGGPTR